MRVASWGRLNKEGGGGGGWRGELKNLTFKGGERGLLYKRVGLTAFYFSVF